jgi:drug/metabolite transporter (DMT)-like permease
MMPHSAMTQYSTRLSCYLTMPITPAVTLNLHTVQGFLAEGLQRTTAGLGSVIIDSQPLTVAVLAALLFGEKLTAASYAGLGLGVLGLSLLEVPVDVLTAFPQKVLGKCLPQTICAWSIHPSTM